MKMNSLEATKRIEDLSKDLNHYNHQYYIENVSEVSDFEYDQRLKELQDLEEKFPNIERDILLDLANDHLVDSCEWYDSLTISKSGET
jgi:NAD-dependent DNA ligase